MSNIIEKLLQLHSEGRIDDSALNKALNALKEPQVEAPASTALENRRKRLRNKRLRKRQVTNGKKLHKNVMNELKTKFLTPEGLILVDKTLCGYLKSYEISPKRYKDPRILFKAKKPIIIKKIINDLLDLIGLKFQLALTVRFTKDKKETTGNFYSFQEALRKLRQY